jgi:hypothetical protein
MELKDTVKGMPKVYYFNSEQSEVTNEHMKRNLTSLGLEHQRIITSNYNKENVKEWVGKLIDAKNYKLPVVTAGYSISVLEFLKDWYESTNEETLILSRDTIDFGIIKYWPFTWDELRQKIPYDWDCFLMGFESTTQIPCYLHPIIPGHNFGMAVLNRRYVKKLIKLHCVGNRYRLVNKIADKNFGGQSGTVDYFIGHCGKTYCMPLFPTHTDFIKKKTKKYVLAKSCRLAYYQWWRTDESLEILGHYNRYTMDELLTYGKANDVGMIKNIPTAQLFAVFK